MNESGSQISEEVSANGVAHNGLMTSISLGRNVFLFQISNSGSTVSPQFIFLLLHLSGDINNSLFVAVVSNATDEGRH